MQPGTILLDKYRTERVIGQGGMGTVVLARHLQLDQLVAIKILLPEAAGNPEIAQRFLNEARAAARLKSEHVCHVYDVGKLDEGTPYMVMEYLEGSDLSGLLRDKGRLEPGVAIDLVLQACEAIAEAHAHGIVHRDVKPSNFFLTRGVGGSTLVKVLDFGISKMPASQKAGLTGTQTVIGTPAYMSPEQMRSSKLVDARTDIWALGVVLYELLAGRLPFDADSFSGICIQVTVEPLPPLMVPLPRGLAEVIARCLEKDPAKRFQTVAELAAALAPHAASPREAQRLVERIERTIQGAEAPWNATTLAAHTVVLENPAGPATWNRSAGEVTGAAGARGKLAWFILAGVGVAIATLIGALLLRGGNGGHDIEPATSQPTSEPAAVDERAAAPPPTGSFGAEPPGEPAAPELAAPAAPAPAAPAFAAEPAEPPVDAGPEAAAAAIEDAGRAPVATPRSSRRRRPTTAPKPDPILGTRQ